MISLSVLLTASKSGTTDLPIFKYHNHGIIPALLFHGPFIEPKCVAIADGFPYSCSALRKKEVNCETEQHHGQNPFHIRE